MNIEKLDKVIEKIEDEIIKWEVSGTAKTEMIKALAELIKARTQMELAGKAINEFI